MTNLTKATANGQVSFSKEEKAEHNAAITAWTAGATDRAAAEVRTQRDVKLVQTDWTQVADAPVDKAAWATYRQSLRTMPEQSGFPDTVTWPTEPE